MRFACEQEPLAYALQKCASVAKASTTFLGNRLIRIDTMPDGLSLTATDTISTTVTYYVRDVDIAEQGHILVDGASLSAFVNTQRSHIKANSTPKNKLHISSGANKMFLSSSEYNFLPVEYDDEKYIGSVEGEALKELLKISVMADHGNLARAYFNGTMLMLDNGHIYGMAASSGKAGYAWAKARYDEKGKFLLPPLAASRLSYFIHDDDAVRLYRDGGKMYFVTNRFLLASSEIAGNYPAKEIVKMCAAEQNHKVIVDRNDFAEILSTCSVMYQGTKDASLKRIKFFADRLGTLNMSTAEENEIGRMDWSLFIKDHQGESFSFYISAMFVDTILGVIGKLFKSDLMYTGEDETITIGISDDSSFVYFSSVDLSAIFVVAPMLGAPVVHKTPVRHNTTDETDVDDEVF